MGRTAKSGCPKCGAKFRTGGLPTRDELLRVSKLGVIELGDPPGRIDCPKCAAPLKVVSVRMGTYFTAE